MYLINKNISYLILFIFIFLSDRISKILIIKEFKMTGDTKIYSSKNLNLELIWNKGVAFGLFPFSSERYYDLMTITILIVILIIFYLFIKSKKIEKFFFILVLSGAIGNFYDRIVYKAVPDFIDIHINNIHWFIFNVSDISISLGVLGLILNEILIKR